MPFLSIPVLAFPPLSSPEAALLLNSKYDLTHALFKVLLKTVKTASKKCKKCFLLFQEAFHVSWSSFTTTNLRFLHFEVWSFTTSVRAMYLWQINILFIRLIYRPRQSSARLARPGGSTEGVLDHGCRTLGWGPSNVRSPDLHSIQLPRRHSIAFYLLLSFSSKQDLWYISSGTSRMRLILSGGNHLADWSGGCYGGMFTGLFHIFLLQLSSIHPTENF